LNALGIVTKEQQLAGIYIISGEGDFLLSLGYVYLLLIFGYQPLGMSLCRLRGRLFMQRINLKSVETSTIDKLYLA
jgi:hypothetical protein